LLQELRVTQTGVQVLFAFLLTLAFTQRFPSLDSVQRGTYITALLLSVLAAALFTAPAAMHRALFRRRAKHQLVSVSSRLAGIGLGVLALSFAAAVLLVVDVVLGRTAGIVAAGGTLAVCAGLWAALPWSLGRRPVR
jgi:small-conductance mechanosensitive channel